MEIERHFLITRVPTRFGNDLLGSMVVELKTADKRDIRTNQFINAWLDNIEKVSGLDKISIRAPSGGPPGRDLDVRFQGENLHKTKTGFK